jgi:hypothetical protein
MLQRACWSWLKLWAVHSRFPCPRIRQPQMVRFATFGIDPGVSTCRREPLSNRPRASRICWPYNSALRSPIPETWRRSESERGRIRQISSSVVSCITTNAGVFCCFAVSLRHSRRYSRSSGSMSDATVCCVLCARSLCAGGDGRGVILISNRCCCTFRRLDLDLFGGSDSS